MTTSPTDSDGAPERGTLATILDVVRRRWLLIAGIVVVCLAIAVARQASATDSYEATASLTFGNASLTDAALQVSRGSGDPERDAATNVLVASSREVAEGVRRQLDTPTDADTLASAVSVEAAPNANVIDVTASTDNADYSARLANAFADQYIAFDRRSQITAIESAEDDLREQIDVLPAGSVERETLEASLQRLTELRAVAGSGVEVISRASPPSSPSGTTLRTQLMLGLLIGLAIALTVTFLLESLDRRVNTIQGFERGYRLPILATVAQSSFKRSRKGSDGSELEPYRILRSALDYVAVTRPTNVLVVTSAVAGEGKTMVSIDLARAIAMSGRNVVLTELDLRRPTLGQRFGLAGEGGVAAALTGRPSESLLVRPFQDLPGLAVLPAGAIPPNPAELVASAAVTDLLSELSDGGQTFVVIDAPPLNPVADTRALIGNPAVQAVLMVGRLGYTSRDQIARARETLDQHMVRPVGVVVTGLRDAERGGYGGSYESVGAAGAVAVAEPPRRRTRR